MTSSGYRPRARRREVIVFTEGEATEVSYVDTIKRLQDRFVVRVDDRHGKPGTIVPLAIDVKRARDVQSRSEGLDPEESTLDTSRLPSVIGPLPGKARLARSRSSAATISGEIGKVRYKLLSSSSSSKVRSVRPVQNCPPR